MPTSPAHRTLAALAAALLPAAAAAQFQPLRLRLPSEPDTEVVAARLSGQGGGDDLLLMRPPGPTFQRFMWHGDLVTARPPFTGLPGEGGLLVAGRFEPAPAGATDDLLFSAIDGALVRWGAAPGAFQPLAALFPVTATGFGKARLLPRPELVLVAPINANGGQATLWAGDLAAARQGGPTPSRTLVIPPLDRAADDDLDTRVYPLRLSPAALAAGVEDVVMPARQALYLAWHRTAPGGAAMAQLDLVGLVSGTRDDVAALDWMPAGSGATPGGSVLGAAALDADGDGIPDLVFSYAHPAGPGRPELKGALLYARSDGTPASLTTPPWHSLMDRPDLSALQDPYTLRQLATDPPALAVFDRLRREILVVRGDARAGFTVAALPADGDPEQPAVPQEMFAADVVGSPAPDLIVQALYPLTEVRDAQGVLLRTLPARAELWVYPDADDPAPRVAFAPPPPAQALRGQDLPLAVVASGVDPRVTVTWMLGDRLSPPLASGSAWTVPGALLCQATASLQVTARATGHQGVFAEAGTTVEVVTRPSLRLLGPSPDLLTLPPGGAAATAEGAAWPACQRTAAFTWGQQQLPGLVEGPLVEDATSSRRSFTLPEGAYPAVLAGAPALTVSATDDLGASGQAILPLRLDAEGLVDVSVTVDRSALARGELTVATARLRSRLGVPLASVRAVFRAAGLVVAGPPSAEGAVLSPGAGAAVEGQVVLDLLPAAGAEVRLSVPLRGVGRPGEVAVELFSNGGHRLTPAEGVAAAPQRLPGCGCGGAGDPAGLALAVLALLALRARRGRGRVPPAT